MISSIKNQQKILDNNRSWSPSGTSQTATPGNFAYIVYPYEHGNISSITDQNGFNITNAFTKVATNVQVNNFAGTSGFTYGVNVYKSGDDGAIGIGFGITIG